MARRLADIDVTDRDDGRILVWDAGSGIHVYQDPAVGGGATAVPIVTETASYTLVADDAGKTVRMDSGSAVDLTVPEESSVDFPVETIIEVRQVGTGTVTIVEDSGVTVNIEAGLTLELRGQYASVSLHKVDSDVWEAVGGFAEDES